MNINSDILTLEEWIKTSDSTDYDAIQMVNPLIIGYIKAPVIKYKNKTKEVIIQKFASLDDIKNFCQSHKILLYKLYYCSSHIAGWILGYCEINS